MLAVVFERSAFAFAMACTTASSRDVGKAGMHFARLLVNTHIRVRYVCCDLGYGLDPRDFTPCCLPSHLLDGRQPLYPFAIHTRVHESPGKQNLTARFKASRTWLGMPPVWRLQPFVPDDYPPPAFEPEPLPVLDAALLLQGLLGTFEPGRHPAK